MYNNERKIIVNTYMKSKILRKIATSLLCMLLCSCTEGCDEKYVDITIYNNSSESIYVTYMMSSTSDYIISSRDINYKDLYLVIKPFESYKFRWVEEQLRCYILHLLIIKSSTMDSYDDKSFYEADDVCDKRYALTYGDLEKMGFIIEYRDDG